MNIAVIGAGNIGTRHLQAITKCREDIRIYAVEPVPAAVEKSREMIKNTEGKHIQDVTYCASIDELPEQIAAAIVATGSMARRAVTEQLLAHADVSYLILEKVLFPRVADYSAVGELLRARGVKAWVNTVRRSWPAFRALKERFDWSGPISLSVEGTMWGLGCNTIHFLDLLYWLGGCKGEVSFDISGLDDGVISSKRSGYIEFTGELRASVGDDRLTCISHRAETIVPGFVIDIQSPQAACRIEETPSDAIITITETASGRTWSEPFEVSFQSSLTNGVISDLLNTGDCALAPYEESARLHVPMIEAFLQKLDNGSDCCNIT